MCGRFTFLFTWKQLHALLALDAFPSFEIAPRYNAAPSQQAAIVRQDAGPGGPRRVGAAARWGLVPPWADSLAVGNMMVNARAETLTSKPAFREAFAKRRCIVPISGFYEWRTHAPARARGSRSARHPPKQPFYIRRPDDAPMLLAGLWERWHDRATPTAPPVDSFTIITCPPNAFMARLHDRMPVILAPHAAELWLDPSAGPESLAPLLVPCPDAALSMHPVSTRVNSPKNDGPDLITPRPEQEPGLFTPSE